MLSLHWPDDGTLKRINRLLIAIIILANGYVLLMPLLPKLNFAIKQNITKPVQVNPANTNSLNAIDRSHNHLVLPTIQLDANVYDGDSVYTVNKGIWRRPQTSTPDKGGNTVLVGHRFTYSGHAVFYSLDNLKVGDDAYLVYSQKLYHYKIVIGEEVPPTAMEVEAPSADAKLTIYTCTPLLTAKNRLVYVGTLVEEVE